MKDVTRVVQYLLMEETDTATFWGIFEAVLRTMHPVAGAELIIYYALDTESTGDSLIVHRDINIAVEQVKSLEAVIPVIFSKVQHCISLV